MSLLMKEAEDESETHHEKPFSALAGLAGGEGSKARNAMAVGSQQSTALS